MAAEGLPAFTLAYAQATKATPTWITFQRDENHCASNARGAFYIPTNGFALTLRYGKEIALTQEAFQTLHSKGVDLLESSNFNSSAPRWEWNLSEISKDTKRRFLASIALCHSNGPQANHNDWRRSQNARKSYRVWTTQTTVVRFIHDDEGRIVGHSHTVPFWHRAFEIGEKDWRGMTIGSPGGFPVRVRRAEVPGPALAALIVGLQLLTPAGVQERDLYKKLITTLFLASACLAVSKSERHLIFY